MSQRNRLLIFAIGGFLAVGAFTFAAGDSGCQIVGGSSECQGDESQAGAAKNNREEGASEKTKPTKDPTVTTFTRIDGIKKTVRAHIKAEYGQGAADYEANEIGWRDLFAQRVMAVFTAFIAFLTAIGLAILIATFRAAKRAAVASEAIITETKRIGEAQTRSYIRIVEARAQIDSDDYATDKKAYTAVVKFVIRNSGQTPAQHYAFKTDVIVEAMGTHTMPFDLTTDNLRVAAALPGQTGAGQRVGSDEFPDTTFQAILRGDVSIISTIVINSQDVFENWETVKMGFYLNFETEGIEGDAIWQEHVMQPYLEKYEFKEKQG